MFGYERWCFCLDRCAMSSFRFKHFLVEQHNSAMRVNTDGVLLGAWMSLPQKYRFLDIGTGTGVIALMAAQRANEQFSPAVSVVIDALEIEEGAFNDAKANFSNSPWGCSSNNTACNKSNIKLSAYLTSLQEFNPISVGESNVDNRYDLIFSNPPYFIESLKSSSSAKCCARHTDTLSQGDLIKHALRLIKPKGIFALVLPVVEGEAFISKINFIRDIALKSGREELFFSLQRLCYIKTTEKKAPKRVLIELVADTTDEGSLNGVTKEEIIISSDGDYSEQYRKLTQEFYLNF